jgi:ABC-type dipeptide/oligopeptide/nickel transport system permease subunit
MAARSERIRLPLDWSQVERRQPARSQGRAFLHALPGGLVIGGILIAIVVLAALFAPLMAPFPPDQLSGDALLLPPSSVHPFGTDALGRDLFSRIVFGARLALRLSLLAVAISAAPGTLLGMIAGFYRGWLDQVLSRVVDAWLALPGLLLALLVIARTGPSLEGAILALGIAGIPGFYRLARSSTISLSQQPFLEASRALGAGGPHLIACHILPNLLSSLCVLVTLRLGTYLLAGGGLSFIGLGAQPPHPEWGAMLAEGRDYVDLAWWMFVFPLLSMTLTVMGFNLLGDGLRDSLSRS